MTVHPHPSPTRTELLWVGDGGWCVCDAACTEDNPRRVLAFLQSDADGVEVTWVRAPRTTERHHTLRAAILAIEEATGHL